MFQINEYVVMNENTLGYVIRKSDCQITIAVVAVDYMKGGDPTLINRETCGAPSSFRKAQEKDKDTFLYKF